MKEKTQGEWIQEDDAVECIWEEYRESNQRLEETV